MENPLTLSENLLEKINDPGNIALGITGSPSTTLEIVIDITEQTKTDRALGQMVYVVLNEDGRNVMVIGQIIEILTKNRWHEDPAFKGVIKRHGSLPHLSGAADNRIATISVQACYDLGQDDPEGYILGTSPSTGVKVFKMNNDVMSALMAKNAGAVTYIGRVYGTAVHLPFWFKHFDETDISKGEFGAGDAYHIGIFGKTGSGKTVTAAFTLLGYSKNKNNLSILVLDPQSQFYLDQKLLPSERSFREEIEKNMVFEKYRILDDISLPGTNVELFAELLRSNGFIRQLFRLYTEDKIELASEEVTKYLSGYTRNENWSLSKVTDGMALLTNMLKSFVKPESADKPFSKYVQNIYSPKQYRERIAGRITEVLDSISTETDLIEKWQSTLDLFSERKVNGQNKLPMNDLVKKVVNQNGNFIVLDLSQERGKIEDENLQARFVTLIENAIVNAGAECYGRNEKANCLVVMDEAHRFIASDSPDERIKALTRDIVGAVRTTRKYGIGYMFITQTIESLDDEIIKQTRVFGFGYGLTSGPELRKTGEIINNKAALQLYKSFIDPSSNQKFPFMFFGPISPLSFTGSPLFIEVYKDFNNFR